MKKSLLFLALAALLMPTALKAQNVIWSYDFSDSTTTMSDWLLINYGTAQYNWEWDGAYGYDEDGCLFGYGTLGYAISPAITIPANVNNATLSWYSYQYNLTYEGETYAPGYLVYITTTRDTLNLDTVYYEYQTQHGYQRQVVDLSDYAGQTIYVIYFLGSTGYTIIDNVSVGYIEVNCDPITSLPWVEDFESGIDCWTAIDNDGDGYGWNSSLYDAGATSFASEGEGSAVSYSFVNNVGPLTPDNWLISPAIPIPAGGTYTLSWDAGSANANYGEEHYAVYVSTGNNVSNFSTPVFETTLTSSDWSTQSVDISAYAGQTVYVAFRHYDCTDMFFFGIDNVSITTGGTTGIADVNAAAISVSPNPASSMVEVSAMNVEGSATVSIVDLNGRTVMQQQGSAAAYRFDVRSLAAGTYFVRLTGENTNAVQKLIVK